MSFLSGIGSGLSIGSTVLSSLSQTPAVQKIALIAGEVGLALITGQTSLRIGNYNVSFKINGAPTRLTLGAALTAFEAIELGQTGSVQSGVVEIDITSITPAVGTGSAPATLAAVQTPPPADTRGVTPTESLAPQVGHA